MDLYKKNLQIIKDRDLYLYKKILKIIIDKDKNNIVEAKDGNYTVKVISDDGMRRIETFLHSKYNPHREAEQFAKVQFENKKKINIIYGFGLGYHVEKMLEKLNKDEKLYVVELNLEVFKLALGLRDLVNVLLDERLELIISDEEGFVAGKLKYLLEDGNKFMTYIPSVKTMPNKYTYFRFIMENWNIKKLAKTEFTTLMKENYERNKKIECENIGMLFNKYKNRPIVIVSAGPSLNKNKHLLKELKEKAVIFSVGSALKPLLKAGVKPDLFCIIDPQPITHKQIEGYEDLDIPLVFLDTASSYTVSKYNGPKYVACNDDTHLENKEYLIDSGGSVATAVMDIAIKFGGNPIVFVGQDLAYINNEHHADGNMYGGDEKVKSLPNMRKVKGKNGEILDTTLGLISFKYWIENKIKDNKEIKFINATEGGAFIEGCKHMKLQEFIDDYFDEDDSFKIEETKNGKHTAKIKHNGKELYIHSKYDPVNEARKSLKDLELENVYKNTVFIMLGIGLGYNLIELYNRVTSENKIIIVEPNVQMLSYAKEINNIQKILEQDNVQIVTGFDVDCFKKIIKDSIELKNYNNIKIVSLSSYKKMYGEYFETIYQEIDIHMNQIKLHIDTNKLLAKKMSENTFENFKHIITRGNSLNKLKNKFEDRPAIIVSAGPSLEKNIHQLKEVQNSAVIIAGGRTLKPLLENGVMPHIICSIDPQEIAFDLIKENTLKSALLVTLVHGNSKVISNHLGKIVFIGDEYYSPVIEHVTNRQFEIIETGGSVATTSLSVAEYMGCNPIAFIGQDLAYTNNKYHSDVACIEKNKNVVNDNNEYIKIKDIYDNEVLTSSNLYYFLCWIEDFINRHKNKHFVNATEGGAKIKGTDNISLKDFIEKYCKDSFLQKEILDDLLERKLVDKEKMIEVRKKLKEIRDNLNNMEQYVNENVCLAKELYKYYTEGTSRNLEDILSEMDRFDEMLDIYKKEELMMYYFMQPYMLDITFKYKEKIFEESKEANSRIVNKELKIYEMKYEATKEYRDCFEEIIKKS